MSEFDRILMQNANMTLGIINLIETLDKNIRDIQTNKDKYLDIRIYRDLKKYLEEVLEVSYGKRQETR